MAQLKNGDPVMVDHTPASAVAAGDVVVIDRSPMIAHRDIPANTLGAVAVHSGVYSELADGAIAAGRKVFWNNSTKRVTLTATGNLVLGIATTTTTGAGQTINFFHQPDGNAAA